MFLDSWFSNGNSRIVLSVHSAIISFKGFGGTAKFYLDSTLREEDLNKIANFEPENNTTNVYECVEETTIPMVVPFWCDRSGLFFAAL